MSSFPEVEIADRILPEHLNKGQLAVLVFGPGVGEAILVRLPDGKIGIIDGCRTPTDEISGEGDPVRELLSQLEIETDPKKFEIEFVCLTHPHAGNATEIFNATAICLDADGKITRLVLAGKADLYT